MINNSTHPINIRYATPSDAAGIARVHIRSWQAAYRGIMPDTVLDGLSLTSRTKKWKKNLSNTQGVMLVAEAESHIVGSVSYGTSRDKDSTETTGEIIAIYVDPDYWSLGIGRRLMNASETGLVELGFTDWILWVLDANTRARTFYEKYLYSLDGGVKQLTFGDKELNAVRYIKSIP